MEFEVQMVYEQKDVAGLVKVLEFRRRPEKNLRLALKIGYPLFGALLVIAGLAVLIGLVAMGLIDPVTILVSLLCLVMGVALLRRSDTRAMAKRSWKRYPNKGMTVTYRFYKDHFEEEDEASGENSFSYASLSSANEDDERFYLFTANNAAHMLRKDSFLQGDPAKFPEFLKIRGAVSMDHIAEG